MGKTRQLAEIEAAEANKAATIRKLTQARKLAHDILPWTRLRGDKYPSQKPALAAWSARFEQALADWSEEQVAKQAEQMEKQFSPTVEKVKDALQSAEVRLDKWAEKTMVAAEEELADTKAQIKEIHSRLSPIPQVSTLATKRSRRHKKKNVATR